MDRIKILLIAANPLETTRLQLDEEIRLITERIHRLPERLRFEIFMNKEEANELPKPLGKRLRIDDFPK